MRREMLISMALGLIILSSLSLAAGSISITGVSMPTSVTQSDTFTITMSVSGSQATSVSGTLTLPSGLSCTPTSSQTISLSGGGTGSASWSCTANVAGDYSNQITAGVSATDSGTGGSLSASSQTGLTVLTPASLTASSTLSSSSIAGGSSTTFTVGVNNLGDSSTTFNITLTLPSGWSASPSSLGNTAISGKSLVNTGFTVTSSSSATSGTYTITATVQSPVQANITASRTLTVTGSTTATTAPSASTTTTTAPSTIVNNTVTANVSSLSVGANTISLGFVANLYVSKLIVNANSALGYVQIVVNNLATKPSSISANVAGNVFNYFEIVPTNITDSNLNNVTISFFVNKTWISSNNINSSAVTLYRYANGAWNALTTTKTSEGTDYINYDAVSPGLSTYAVSGQANTVTAPPTNITNNTQVPPVTPTLPAQWWSNWYIIVAIAVVAIAVYIILNRKPGSGSRSTGKWDEVKKKW